MSAFPGRALHVIAEQLLAVLVPYEEELARLVRCWPDDALLARAWGHMERIRSYSGNVPEVRVQAASVLIAHAELVRLLCRAHASYEVGLGRDIAQAHASHRESVAALRFRLQWVLNRSSATIR